MDLSMERKIVLKRVENGEDSYGNPIEQVRVYGANYYYMELNTAKMLHDLNVNADIIGSCY